MRTYVSIVTGYMVLIRAPRLIPDHCPITRLFWSRDGKPMGAVLDMDAHLKKRKRLVLGRVLVSVHRDVTRRVCNGFALCPRSFLSCLWSVLRNTAPVIAFLFLL